MFQFRASVNYEDVRNPARRAAGLHRSANRRYRRDVPTPPVSAFSDALFYPPGIDLRSAEGRAEHDPHSDVGFRRVNLADIRSVQFRFNQTGCGRAAHHRPCLHRRRSGARPARPRRERAEQSSGERLARRELQRQRHRDQPGAAGAPVSTTRFYVSLDTSKGAGDILLTGTRAVPALGSRGACPPGRPT